MLHLVTGGSGYLGHLIVKRLTAAGERVRVLDVLECAPVAGVEFVHGDVRDPDVVRTAMQGVGIVHHTAARVPASRATVRQYEDTNVGGTVILASEAARAGVSAFVHMSSSAVYGTPQCPVDPEAIPLPVEPYGRSKLKGETQVHKALDSSRCRLIVIRPRTILGSGRLGIFQLLFEWIRVGKDVYVLGDGENRIQFVHASDLLDFHFLALESGASGTFNVGSDRFTPLGTSLETLARHARSRSRVRRVPPSLVIPVLQLADRLSLSPLAPWHYLTYHRDFYFDVEPLLRMGWKPRYSNDEMMRESYDSYVSDRMNASTSKSPNRRILSEQFLRIVRYFS